MATEGFSGPAVTFPFPLGHHVDHSHSLVLVAQGAEALVYRTTYLLPTIPCALKYRPPKPYRHPTLDARLTRHRVLSEARVLVKCRRQGVRTPALYHVDWERGWLMMEWVPGVTIKHVLTAFVASWPPGQISPMQDDVELQHLMDKVGRVVGRLHVAGVVHGDLTTSNLMLGAPGVSELAAGAGGSTSASEVDEEGRQRPPERPSLDGDIVLIDFGLAAQSVQDEDRAIDLYVLERAFGSTHPTMESLFALVLRAYETSFRGAKSVLARLDDVRLRGRKKSMLG
ncbi:MAG: hypothetical protein M1815_002340 [Lichina confinis]|nr:MAG: hypothetical protein M1815_002340 [Lichina confinis]